ncbi:hypothetical protein EGP91_02465 [bacterium]|nr:hypothetical protein [bacterium]
MDKKITKSAGITIVILLVLSSFLGGYGMFLHHSKKQIVINNEKPNTNKEKFFDNKLWFYTEDGELIGNYECTSDDCDIAKNTVTDGTYKKTFINSTDYVKVIQDRYAFITDDGITFLYDIKTKSAYKTIPYKEVKDYGKGLTNDNVILTDSNGNYGVMSFLNMPHMIIPFEDNYEFIGLSYEESDSLLNSDYFITLKDGAWNIIDYNDATLTANITEPIVAFNGDAIILENISNENILVDYNNNEKLSMSYKKLTFTGKYLNCTTHDDTFYVYDLMNNKIISDTFSLSGKDGSTILDEKSLKVYIGNSLRQTIKLS